MDDTLFDSGIPKFQISQTRVSQFSQTRVLACAPIFLCSSLSLLPSSDPGPNSDPGRIPIAECEFRPSTRSRRRRLDYHTKKSPPKTKQNPRSSPSGLHDSSGMVLREFSPRPSWYSSTYISRHFQYAHLQTLPK